MKATCDICTRGCVIPEGETGFCGMYTADAGKVVERFEGHYLVACPISIETAPFLHFHPGAKFLQISTVGCNLDCPGCISNLIVRNLPPGNRLLTRLSPEQIIDRALAEDCRGIVFLMNDPIASFPAFLNVARIARESGLLTACSTNGLFSDASLARLLPFIDAVNIGLKGGTEAAYAACKGKNGAQVFRNLRVLKENRVHAEVSCMLRSDNPDDVRLLANRISDISPDIPFQVMRFLPFGDADISLEATIREASLFCHSLKPVLSHVYLFNSPGTDLLHTRCAECGRILVKRDFYGPMGAKLLSLATPDPASLTCPDCERVPAVCGGIAADGFRERGFEGGYPFTRALEMVEAMLIAMGETRFEAIATVWETVLSHDGLFAFHHDIQKPETYITALRRFGAVIGAQDRAEALAVYLEQKLAMVTDAVSGITRRPRVLYVMGSPLFALNPGRMENQLCERAGGISVNKELDADGRPGRTLSPKTISQLQPDVIVVSAFLSSPVHEVMEECRRLRIKVPAVIHNRIYTPPSPGWDFGSPRWILGLLYLASVFHPDHCPWDTAAIADEFYRTFYGIPFTAARVNRSFSRPSKTWAAA